MNFGHFMGTKSRRHIKNRLKFNELQENSRD